MAIKLAGDFSEWVNGVLSFAPGEYFERFGKSATWITESAASVECPTFITSAKNEQPLWQPIYDAIPSENKHFFLPETEGNHGSRALWEQFDDHSDYWDAVTEFLTTHVVD